MSFDADNGENIVKDSKSGEDVKSPGRLAAEERAERIRNAEEYRKKLEAEKVPVPPKKTKAAEQKEQAKIDQLAREQEEIRAMLEEQKLESERRINAAKERIASLSESIEKAETAPLVPEIVKVEAPPVSQPTEYKASEENKNADWYKPPKKKISPIKLKNLVVHIPVQSFSFPCVVKRKTKVTSTEPEVDEQEDRPVHTQTVQPIVYQIIQPQQPSPVFVPLAPQMPYIPPMPMMPPAPPPRPQPVAEPVVETRWEPAEKKTADVENTAKPKPKAPVQLKQAPIVPTPIPQPVVPAKPEPKFLEVGRNKDEEWDPLTRPIITYGASVTQGGWEYEIVDEDDIIIEEETMPIDEDPSLVNPEDLDPTFADKEETDSAPADAETNPSSQDIEGVFSEAEASPINDEPTENVSDGQPAFVTDSAQPQPSGFESGGLDSNESGVS